MSSGVEEEYTPHRVHHGKRVCEVEHKVIVYDVNHVCLVCGVENAADI